MRKAIIDLGTNTFHLLIADISGGEIIQVFKKQIPVKLGEKGINEGEIAPAAFARGIDALTEFRSHLDLYRPKETLALATSAIRSAKNGHVFITEAFNKTQIVITTIDGDREAELIFRGVSASLPVWDENFLVMDIGGGSVEFIIGNKGRIIWKESFEIGCARLIDIYHTQDPILEEDVKKLIAFIDRTLQSLKDQFLITPFHILTGSAGSFESISEILASMHPQEQMDAEASYHQIDIKSYLKLHRKLLGSSYKERSEMPGLADYRIEMIVVASILIHYVVTTFHIQTVICSHHSLKEGALLTDSVQ